ncbi:MAG: PEP-utilizing enzyme [Candidatus Thorarchaeota archaeon]
MSRRKRIKLKEVARGLISLKLTAEGELRYVTTMMDVIQLLKEGADGKIVLVNDGGTTFLAPVLSKLAGVVCISGALGSHLAIVTREFEIPALMGTGIDNPQALDRRNVIIEPVESTIGRLLLSDEA